MCRLEVLKWTVAKRKRRRKENFDVSSGFPSVSHFCCGLGRKERSGTEGAVIDILDRVRKASNNWEQCVLFPRVGLRNCSFLRYLNHSNTAKQQLADNF